MMGGTVKHGYNVLVRTMEIVYVHYILGIVSIIVSV
jgi:hypothetical protein